MKTLNGGQVIRLPLDAIHVGARLRPTSEAAVATLALMAEDSGITTPIHVRKTKGEYHLIDGAHRLAAARKLGLPDIACLAVACREDEARAMEASNNLGAARMTPLQTAVFVASWKKDYYAAHPDRKPGVFKGNRHTGNLVGAESALTSSIAEAFAIAPRRAYRLLAVGERLTAGEREALEQAGRNLALDQLEALARIREPEERLAVVQRLAADPKARVASSLRALRAEAGRSTAVESEFDRQLRGLRDAWSRAGTRVRRAFLAEAGVAIANLLAPEDREAAE